MLNYFRRKPVSVTAEDILHQILDATPQATSMAPKDCRGIYGLVDHLGDLRDIGSTSSAMGRAGGVVSPDHHGRLS